MNDIPWPVEDIPLPGGGVLRVPAQFADQIKIHLMKPGNLKVMPRTEVRQVFRWLYVASVIDDYDQQRDHRVGFTALHAMNRLVRSFAHA